MPDERRRLTPDPGRTAKAEAAGFELPPWVEKALVPILLVARRVLLPFFFDSGERVHPEVHVRRSRTS